MSAFDFGGWVWGSKFGGRKPTKVKRGSQASLKTVRAAAKDLEPVIGYESRSLGLLVGKNQTQLPPDLGLAKRSFSQKATDSFADSPFFLS